MLTKRQAEALEIIRKFKDKFGYAPSVRELMAALGASSPSVVHRVLKGLEERGHIRRLFNRTRAIEIVSDPHYPSGLAQVPDTELAAEARRRGLVLGHIVKEWHHAQGESQPVAIRKFKEIA